MANIAYVLRKAIGIQSLYFEFSKFDSLVNIESLTNSDYQTAIKLMAKDLEDALQYSCAVSSKCDVIVTRNKKDFLFEGIDVLTPGEFITKYGINKGHMSIKL